MLANSEQLTTGANRETAKKIGNEIAQMAAQTQSNKSYTCLPVTSMNGSTGYGATPGMVSMMPSGNSYASPMMMPNENMAHECYGPVGGAVYENGYSRMQQTHVHSQPQMSMHSQQPPPPPLPPPPPQQYYNPYQRFVSSSWSLFYSYYYYYREDYLV